MSDAKRLVKALRKVGAKPYQVTMAATLLAINGIENALEFVFGLQARGLTLIAADAPPLGIEQGNGIEAAERG